MERTSARPPPTSHAFTLGVNQRSLVVFTYDVPLGGPNVTTARMQAIYFGAVISTDQVSTHTNLSGTGSGTMNWTLGTFTYLLAGLYLLTASLVDSNGTTVWSESFYMQASAPYHVGSGLIIFLIVLALVELYSIATVGRSARKRPKALSSAPPTPWQQPSSTAEGGAATPSGETPPTGSPPTEGSP